MAQSDISSSNTNEIVSGSTKDLKMNMIETDRDENGDKNVCKKSREQEILEEKILVLEERIEEYKETIRDLRKDKDKLNTEKSKIEKDNAYLREKIKRVSSMDVVRKCIEFAEIVRTNLSYIISDITEEDGELESISKKYEEEEEEDGNNCDKDSDYDYDDDYDDDDILKKMLDLVDDFKDTNINSSKMFPNAEYFKNHGITRHYINKYKISGLKEKYKERINKRTKN